MPSKAPQSIDLQNFSIYFWCHKRGHLFLTIKNNRYISVGYNTYFFFSADSVPRHHIFLSPDHALVRAFRLTSLRRHGRRSLLRNASFLPALTEKGAKSTGLPLPQKGRTTRPLPVPAVYERRGASRRNTNSRSSTGMMTMNIEPMPQ